MAFQPFITSDSKRFITSDNKQYKTYYEGQTFDVQFYENTSEPNRVDKTNYITSQVTLSGTLREECNLLAPVILVNRSTWSNSMNYCYIAQFGRYYFATGVTSVKYGLWRVELKCDVLMTYKSSIGNLTATISRQQQNYNDYLVDNQLPIRIDAVTDYQIFTSTAFNNQLSATESEPQNGPATYVLTCLSIPQP